MGSITQRKSKKGGIRYTAQIRKKQGGKVVVDIAKTFENMKSAKAWVQRMEAEIKSYSSLEAFISARKAQIEGPDTTGIAVIDAYLKGHTKPLGKSKRQALNMLKRFPIAKKDWRNLTTADFIEFGEELFKGAQPEPIDIDTASTEDFIDKPRKPQTVANILSHMGPLLQHGGSILGKKLPHEAFCEARETLKFLGIVSRSGKRERRPSLEELDKLMTFFFERHRADRRCIPMHLIILFQILGCRRLSETTRMQWCDYERENGQLLIRDMKHPSKKIGNDVFVKVLDEQALILEAMPRQSDRIFPYSTDAISRNFTNGCKACDIKDLHLHDLRHEGVSRLFEMGLSIAEVKTVSAHSTLVQLQRYANIKMPGDKLEGWIWIERLKRGELTL